MQLHPVIQKGGVSEAYSADDYDYEDDDFEDDEGHEKSPVAKRIGTPHSSKKGAANKLQWNDDDEKEMEDGGGLDVEGQDLESYMKHYSSSESNNATNIEDLACELKPLEGVRPKLDNVEEEKLLHKLGYSYSNNSSPVKSSGYAVRTDNSPSPSMKYYQPHHVGESWNSSKYDSAKFKLEAAKFESNLVEVTYKEENPSTRTSKDTKNSPTPTQGEKNNHKVGFSLAKQQGASDDHNSSDEEGSGFTSPKTKNGAVTNSKSAANYMDNFKNLLDTEPSPQGKGPSPKQHKHEPSAADLILLSKKQPTPGEERENAERVDALLMELFPERYDKKTKKPKAGGGKKAAAGYNKNQAYGLAAPRAPPSVEYLYSSSAHSSKHSQMNMHAHPQDDEDAHSPLMQSLDQQLRLLKKELKTKDDKITRLTEHAVMMGHHMDKLKGEAAHLTVQLREANLELDAKEARLQEALKQRKKAKKAAAAGYGGNGNNSSSSGNNNADSAALENENARLRDREQALMDAIEELSNQNEDLIEKLKESMERELILSSKRAAQINHTVSNITAEQSHHQSYHHLPSIGAAAGANAGLRTHSQPEQSVAAGAKKATRKKRA